jgi:hypothetical protein
MRGSEVLQLQCQVRDFISTVKYLGSSSFESSAGSESVSIQGRFETCPTGGWSVDLCGRITVAVDVGAV